MEDALPQPGTLVLSQLPGQGGNSGKLELGNELKRRRRRRREWLPRIVSEAARCSGQVMRWGSMFFPILQTRKSEA